MDLSGICTKHFFIEDLTELEMQLVCWLLGLTSKRWADYSKKNSVPTACPQQYPWSLGWGGRMNADHAVVARLDIHSARWLEDETPATRARCCAGRDRRQVEWP